MFPPFEEWCDTVLHPDDTHPWNFRTPEFYEEYRLKYALAKLIQPKSIMEVGVRFGYSANSFLCAVPKAMYVGLDMDEPSWGPFISAPRVWAEKTLIDRYPNASIVTWHTNTQTQEQKFIPRSFDMIHIDADHSYKGALHDMLTFWAFCRRVMVVDDVSEILQVEMAVEDFLRATPTAILCGTMTALRGAAVIVREDDKA
jgi:predicted O-methyltransferase YrrM